MTMEIEIVRDVFGQNMTLGLMSVDNSFFGYTEEDEDRHLELDNELIPGFVIRSFADRRKRPHGYEYDDRRQTHYRNSAIPRGRFRVSTSWSARFRETTPEILAVPEFIGIRIFAEDRTDMTTGSVRLGSQRDEFGIRDVLEVNRHLLALVQEAEANREEIWITVR